MMLDTLAAGSALAANGVIHWQALGLTEGIDLGFFTLKYYSLAYLAGIALGYWHLTRMIKAPGAPLAQRHAEDLFFWCTLGIILGGRLGYATFYQPGLWTDFSHPGLISWGVLRLWDGGMSFHGGLIGVLAAIGWVSWRAQLNFMRVCDYIAVNVGFGMLFGRLANFVNGELWGRAAGPDVPWAMTFCDVAKGPGDLCQSTFIARHPSQLYQALGEGLIVIIVMLALFWLTRARFRTGVLVGTFTVVISLARFVVEFYRQPDAQLLWLQEQTGLSMGQWLTIPLIIAGLALVAWSLSRPAQLAPGSLGKAPPEKA